MAVLKVIGYMECLEMKKELFVSKVDPGSPRAERKLSAATAPSMKTKWLKAIKSLKPASGSAVQTDSIFTTFPAAPTSDDGRDVTNDDDNDDNNDDDDDNDDDDNDDDDNVGEGMHRWY
uniref:Uncharacterized protein n=1 Tax=Glossina palpalis gambiensis TaxID=67801 RepID=A0A1B0AZP2_9MUSC